MIQLFIEGGPIMWPILILSIFTLAVILERFFLSSQKKRTRSNKFNPGSLNGF